MKRFYLILCMTFTFLVMLGCSQHTIHEENAVMEKNIAIKYKDNDFKINPPSTIDLTDFENIEPTEWGENVTGVKNRIKTKEKKLALTFDACGGDYGSAFDEQLISFLIKENIPATLFVNERWIHEHKDIFIELSSHPQFQIENHGTNHSPLSVNGGEAWGIEATKSPEEVYDEIMNNHQTVKELIGRDMTLFRSGTAYYDEIAVKIANELGYDVVNFDILGDAGATYTSTQVKNALLQAKNGSIALLHMNQPNSGTAEGVKQAIPLLKDLGFEFVTLKGEILE